MPQERPVAISKSQTKTGGSQTKRAVEKVITERVLTLAMLEILQVQHLYLQVRH